MRDAQFDAEDSHASRALELHAAFWNSLGPGSVAYTITELFDHLPDYVSRTLWCLAEEPYSKRNYRRPVMPEILYRFLCRVGIPAKMQGRLASHVMLRSLEPGALFYMWPPYDFRLIQEARRIGAII